MENYFDAASIQDKIGEIRHIIGQAAAKSGCQECDIHLMAVTKTQPVEAVNAAIGAGIRLLGENRAQELIQKYDGYDKAHVEIHFIGGLQTNKVRQIIDKVTMIQSVDRVGLAQEIQRCCEQRDIHMDVLLEVNVGGELSKSGISPDELPQLMEQISTMHRIRVKGLMCVPPICDKPQDLAVFFERMRRLFIDIKEQTIDNMSMQFLSMGMTHDYPLAIEHGANLVRIGSGIFGPRTAAR